MFGIALTTKNSVGAVYLLWVEDRGPQRLICFKYYNVLNQEIRFTLGLNAAEITDYMKKSFSKSCSELNFLQRSQWAHMCISPRGGARGSKDCHVLNIIMYCNHNEPSMCNHWFLCTKFNSQQLLFEQFFGRIGNFGSVQPENESTLPSLYNII